ncbi:hypothetical protein [Actinomadura opuntiae]|uniref:hypothetical protein n=1 Tax=Actinomadura sp. OS1-43 TaxID=604315 RepID=UPI00255A840D|nr:hypothetical protein [Actinomadura sp. OS1-43]MDL4814976.1 hypothetical protein [Actinomadura sp. OS1-43]
MNLYAIRPVNAPACEVEFILAEDDQEAMRQGVFAAAKDVCDGNYFSPHADVYLIASDVRHVGKAWATDAPREWEWAYPGVLENAAEEAVLDATYGHGAADV